MATPFRDWPWPIQALIYLGIAFLIVLLTGCWAIDRLYDSPIRRQLSRAIPTIQSFRMQS